jgi:hypothetical protein
MIAPRYERILALRNRVTFETWTRFLKARRGDDLACSAPPHIGGDLEGAPQETRRHDCTTAAAPCFARPGHAVSARLRRRVRYIFIFIVAVGEEGRLGTGVASRHMMRQPRIHRSRQPNHNGIPLELPEANHLRCSRLLRAYMRSMKAIPIGNASLSLPSNEEVGFLILCTTPLAHPWSLI